MAITFKVRFNDAFLRFSLNLSPDDNPFEKLKDALREREVPTDRIFWVDEEDCRIYLRNLLDMKDCLEGNEAGGLIRLTVEPETNSGIVWRGDVQNQGIIVSEVRTEPSTEEIRAPPSSPRHRRRSRSRSEGRRWTYSRSFQAQHPVTSYPTFTCYSCHQTPSTAPAWRHL